MMNYKLYTQDIEKVENYDLARKDGFKGWHCHHRMETHTGEGELRSVQLSREELIGLDRYYNVRPEELVFMTTAEHMRLHHLNKRKETVASDYYAKNRERLCARQREYDRAHKEHKRAYMREYMRSYYHGKKEAR